MSRALLVRSVGPGVTVQDLGREGFLAFGLSRGGAADCLAIAEGAVLLGQSGHLAALEMAGQGGRFEAEGDVRIALTGAPMRATIDGAAVQWNASHMLKAGQVISIGAVTEGTYGYLHVGGGIATMPVLGSRSTQLTAGIGSLVRAGARLPIGAEEHEGGATGLGLAVEDRFNGGRVRCVPSAQTGRFSAETRTRFEATEFVRDLRGNRQGVRLNHGSAPFTAEGQLSIPSEIIVPGDIQIIGDGTPYVLLPECQTMGGYPRIGTVVPDDLPIVAQADPGVTLTFEFVTVDDALHWHRRNRQTVDELRKGLQRLVRDPRDMRDLLSYQLIGGVTSGDDSDS
ncbi:MAG: urea amidolyase [Rhodobacteraceae bacterium]|nr:urea amidolyase [Paracoccaceae bacterium]